MKAYKPLDENKIPLAVAWYSQFADVVVQNDPNDTNKGIIWETSPERINRFAEQELRKPKVIEGNFQNYKRSA